MNLLNNVSGFIISLCMGVFFVIQREIIVDQIIDSTLESFRNNAKKRRVFIQWFVLCFGMLLILVSLIFLYKIIRELAGFPVLW